MEQKPASKTPPAHEDGRWYLNRRRFLGGVGLGTAFFTVRGAFAQQLVLTPAQTEGPYYPVQLPLDTDNDLLVINDRITPAVGEVSYVSGRVLDAQGQPVRDAYVEIWQADQSGAYIHSASAGYQGRDQNFQGFGRFLTGSTGEYLFRTIKPGLYPGRTRHIHFKVKVPGRAAFTTQLYVAGEPLNNTDGVLQGIRDAAARNSVIVPFVPIEDSAIGALAARFDVVLAAGQSFTPSLTLSNTTSADRNPAFRIGDLWRLELRGATPAARVYLHIWKGNDDLGISGPYGPLTGGDGSWFLSGSFGASETGTWRIQGVIGTPSSGETTRVIDWTIA